MKEEDIKWLCSMARSGCNESATDERCVSKREKVNKLEKELLKKEEQENGKEDNKKET